MPGNSISVGGGIGATTTSVAQGSQTPSANLTAATTSPAQPKAPTLFGSEPALAAIDHMDMSAPIQPISPSDPVGEVPHRPAPASTRVIAVPPLSADVAPFKVPEPRVPATEYVQLTPAPAQPAVLPPQPVAIPAPRAAQPVAVEPTQVKPNPVPALPFVSKLPPPSNQAIGPIIRKRPVPPATLVPPAASSPVGPQPHLPPPPSRSIRVRSEAPALAPLQSVPSLTASNSLSPSTLATPSFSTTATTEQSQPVLTPAVDAALTSAPLQPIFYSQNTQAVWQARRAMRIVNILTIVGICIVLAGLCMYWRELGSPTRVEDLPIIGSPK